MTWQQLSRAGRIMAIAVGSLTLLGASTAMFVGLAQRIGWVTQTPERRLGNLEAQARANLIAHQMLEPLPARVDSLIAVVDTLTVAVDSVIVVQQRAMEERLDQLYILCHLLPAVRPNAIPPRSCQRVMR